jgi:hypothetical protein
MSFIQTAGRSGLFVTDWGSGPPVVFTHAWGLRSDQWNYQVPALAAAGLRCVLYGPAASAARQGPKQSQAKPNPPKGGEHEREPPR